MNSLDQVEELFSCKSAEELLESLVLLARRNGFQQVLFGLKASKAANYENSLILTNYDASWRKIYKEQRLHLVDPTVEHATRHLKPLVWNRGTFRTRDEWELYEQSSSFGLKAGITLPIHGTNGEFGLMSFACDAAFTDADALARMTTLSLIRDLAFECCLSMPSPYGLERPTKSFPLTPRESECLRWLTSGKTSWEISRILACSEATVNFHVSNILKKFGVLNRQHAVAKGLLEGLVVT